MKTLAAALLLPVVLLAACKKKEAPPTEATPVASVAAARPVQNKVTIRKGIFDFLWNRGA